MTRFCQTFQRSTVPRAASPIFPVISSRGEFPASSKLRQVERSLVTQGKCPLVFPQPARGATPFIGQSRDCTVLCFFIVRSRKILSATGDFPMIFAVYDPLSSREIGVRAFHPSEGGAVRPDATRATRREHLHQDFYESRMTRD